MPPDPPGYFDGYVWPMYLKNRKVMEETVNDMGTVIFEHSISTVTSVTFLNCGELCE